MIELPQRRTDTFGQRREMRLVENCLNELAVSCDRPFPTHIALHVRSFVRALHTDEVTQHTAHEILAADDNVLPKVSQAARVGHKLRLRDAAGEALREVLRERWPGQCRSGPRVEWTRDEDEVRLEQERER